MQPMPAKNRTAVLLGVALLALIVGSVAVWSSRQNAQDRLTDLDDLPAYEAPINAGTAPINTGGLPITSPTTPLDTATEVFTGTTPLIPITARPTVPDFHVVTAGENLSDISRMYYNDHIYAGDIEALNDIEDANHIMVGQELRLPTWDALDGDAVSVSTDTDFLIGN